MPYLNRSRMGRDLFKYGILQLNYPDSTYAFDAYVLPPADEHPDYGFIPVMDGDDITTGCVWKGAGAEQQGLQAGDQILKIDDWDFTTMSKCEVVSTGRKMLSLKKDTITLTYRHKNNKPITIVLEKQDL